MKLRVMMALCCVLGACETEPAGRAEQILSLSGDVASGEIEYTTNCVSCHSADGSGGIGSNIQDTDVEVMVDAMLNGRSGMISYADLLQDQQIADIAAYAETL